MRMFSWANTPLSQILGNFRLHLNILVRNDIETTPFRESAISAYDILQPLQVIKGNAKYSAAFVFRIFLHQGFVVQLCSSAVLGVLNPFSFDD